MTPALGRYFGAKDQAGLSEALAEALRVPFRVLDTGGSEVAIGQVGGAPVELAAGSYTVSVSTKPMQVFERVEVEGNSALQSEVD